MCCNVCVLVAVSRLGPLPPLLEEDYEDEMYDESRANSTSPSCSTSVVPANPGPHGGPLSSIHEVG